MTMFTKGVLAIAATLAFATHALAAEPATAEEATALVKRGVAFVKANGKDKLIAEVANSKGQFVNGELYLSVWDAKATVLAHGANPKMVGKNVIELKDADEKYFMKEIVAKAAAPGNGWVDYKWINPVTKQIQAKSAYVEKVDDIIISAGYYKK
ncbi:cache domain-containing protein [Massilia sp. DJPM01]|uniref:cache domain-containing protein n=1 Tax=Massilia sp. DJPM01 TaxID=3024404 RepID=UPI00259FAB89|nr:cache domain-containing protein [Massilia sp. DJPM01]MDM5181840.1 cache domain-containing protein [Massilia sp. DJPM01]